MSKEYQIAITALILSFLVLVLVAIQKPAGTILEVRKDEQSTLQKSGSAPKPLPAIKPQIKSYTIRISPDHILPGGITICPQDRLELTFQNLTQKTYIVQNEKLPLSFGPIEAGTSKTFSYQVPQVTGIFPIALQPESGSKQAAKTLKLIIKQSPSASPSQLRQPFLNPPSQINCPEK